MSIEKIFDFINNNEWNKLIDLIKSEPKFVNVVLYNRNNLAHIGAVNNNFELIDLLLDNKKLFMTINKEGDTPLHIMANYNFYKLLKKVLIKYPKLINLQNNTNNTIMHLINPKRKLYQWILENNKFIDVNIVNNYSETILIQNINISKSKEDIYYQNILLILNKHPNIQLPKSYSALLYSIVQNKNYISDILIKNIDDVNFKNLDYVSPLIVALINNNYEVIQKLIKKGADVNYTGSKGQFNPIVIAAYRDNIKIVDLLLDNNFNLSLYDEMMNTPLHKMFEYDVNGNIIVKDDIMAKLIYNGNLNAKNVNGITPFYLLIKTNKWKQFNKILEEKKLDIFVKDLIKLVNENDYELFMETIVTSYLNQLADNNTFKECDNKQNLKSEECRQFIRKYIFESKSSIPQDPDNIFIKNNFKLIKGTYTNYGRFNSDILHNLIYTIIMLKRYDNLIVPFQYNIDDKIINDKLLLKYTNIYKFEQPISIPNYIKLFVKYFYEISPYVIIWKSSTEYYLHKDLKFYLLKCFFYSAARYILFKLVLISNIGIHANILIFDKTTGILERFEPYGNIPHLESDKLNIFLKKKLGNYFNKYLSKNNIKFKYQTVENIGLQAISRENNPEYRKLGDPDGYCLAWTFWYLEMRINNKNIKLNDLIQNSIKDIISNSSLIEFIRDYAYKLDEEKNKYLKNIGIKNKYIYNIVFPKKVQNKLIKQFKEDFNNLSFIRR